MGHKCIHSLYDPVLTKEALKICINDLKMLQEPRFESNFSKLSQEAIEQLRCTVLFPSKNSRSEAIQEDQANMFE